MIHTTRNFLQVALGISVGACILTTASQANALTLGAWTSYTQNFDALASTGTGHDITTIPALDGWSIYEIGGNDRYAAGNGSAANANTYSYGAAGSSERALGSVASGSLQSIFGVKFDIVAGPDPSQTEISSLIISYAGEQWRQGRKSPDLLDNERLDFQYSTDATALSNGTWTDFDSLDLTPIDPYLSGVGSGVATDGNVKRKLMSATISGLSINPGDTLWLRWVDSNSSGNDFGLAIDDFSITAVPTPALLPGILGMGLGLWRKRKQQLVQS